MGVRRVRERKTKRDVTDDESGQRRDASLMRVDRAMSGPLIVGSLRMEQISDTTRFFAVVRRVRGVVFA